MKILWVKGGKLLPVDTGGKIRSYNILRHLAKKHDVTYLSYYSGRRDPSYESALLEKFPVAHIINIPASESTLSQYLDYLLRLHTRAPYAVTKFTHAPVRRTVTQWLNEKRFDVAVCDFLSASLNFPARDREERLKMNPRCHITVVPTGVDTELYRVAPSAADNPPIVVFTGSMDWEPNIDAVEYFCNQIWPTILAEFPNARFQIVGRDPHSRVRRLENKS